MSYTAPTYVDTKEQAVLALASAIKGEAVTGGDGSVNRALDLLADVLAEQDVQVPQTDAGAILALAQYASGMVKPEGTITITENGTGIDVAQYATADVSVSGGGGGETYTISVYELDNDTPVPSESKVYIAEWSQDQMKWSASATEASEAAGGTVISADSDHAITMVMSSLDRASMILYPNDASVSYFTMPAHDVYVMVAGK